jgi:tetratricopeptide (TPR) repeat protein
MMLMGASLLFAQDAPTETAAGLYNEGLASLKNKEYSTAYDKIMKSIEIADPENENDAKVLPLAKANGSIACYYLGQSLLKETKFDEAMAKFEQGLELNAKSYTNQYGIASALDKKGMIPEAVDAYLKAASVATEAGKADRAGKYVERAGNKVGVTYGKKNYDDAIAAGELFLAEHESADVSFYVSKALLKKGKAADAVQHAEKAKELGKEEGEGKYIMNYAEALEAAGQKAAAKAAYGQVPSGKYAQSAKYKADQIK